MKTILAYLIVALVAFYDAFAGLFSQSHHARLANAIVNRTVILGVKSLKFARDGEAGTSSTSKPALGAAAYESLGRVEKAVVANKVEDLVIRNSGTGTYGDELTIPVSQQVTLEFTMQNINQIIVEALYLTVTAITVGTALQPMAQTAKIKGWLHVVRTDQTGTETLLEFLWVELSITKGDTAEKSHTYELSARVLKNTLNTLEIDALTAL